MSHVGPYTARHIKQQIAKVPISIFNIVAYGRVMVAKFQWSKEETNSAEQIMGAVADRVVRNALCGLITVKQPSERVAKQNRKVDLRGLDLVIAVMIF